jgi:DNA-binding MarR family transcriptional regulator
MRLELRLVKQLFIAICKRQEIVMSQDPAPPLDSQLCFSLYAASIAVNRTYKPMLDGLGLTYPQYLVLSTLWEQDGLPISAIADRLSLESSTITPLVKRLESAGFLTRLRNPKDERQVLVSLTAKGGSMKEKTACLTQTLLERSGLTVDQIVKLNRQVQGLRDALTRG